MQTLRKKMIPLLLAFLLLPSISYSSALVFAVKSSDIEPYNAALRGVREVFEDSGFRVRIEEFDLDGNESRWGTVLKKVREERPNLIITFGTFATKMAKGDIKNMPIVFSTVLNPEESGIVNSLSSPNGNITGSSIDIPIETQFYHILQMVPSAKRVGVLYNPRETGSIINRAREVAAQKGLTLIAEIVRDEASLPKAIDNIMGKIDVLWSVADGTVFSPPAVQQIIIEAIKHRVPFMGISPSFVKAGALFSMKWDDADIGRQAGEVALRIISREEPSGIPVTTPRKVSLSINLKTAEAIGVEVPRDLSKGAEVVR
jgi:putative ABC transport system substrate-binding protein